MQPIHLPVRKSSTNILLITGMLIFTLMSLDAVAAGDVDVAHRSCSILRSKALESPFVHSVGLGIGRKGLVSGVKHVTVHTDCFSLSLNQPAYTVTREALPILERSFYAADARETYSRLKIRANQYCICIDTATPNHELVSEAVECAFDLLLCKLTCTKASNTQTCSKTIENESGGATQLSSGPSPTSWCGLSGPDVHGKLSRRVGREAQPPGSEIL